MCVVCFLENNQERERERERTKGQPSCRLSVPGHFPSDRTEKGEEMYERNGYLIKRANKLFQQQNMTSLYFYGIYFGESA